MPHWSATNWAGSRVMQTKIEVFGILENFVPTQSWVRLLKILF